MAEATLAKLLEANLATAINAQSWAGTGVAPAHESLGAQLVSFPSIKIECNSGNEEPANSGNFSASVDVIVFGGLDPDNDSNYATITDAHTALCGSMEDYLTGTLSNSALEGATSGYSNNLEVYDIRLVSFARAIDTSGGVFEDTWTLEINCRTE